MIASIFEHTILINGLSRSLYSSLQQTLFKTMSNYIHLGAETWRNRGLWSSEK